jgi:hypothetical protein
VFTVRNAIHVQTGQRVLVEQFDRWLERHDVSSAVFEDAYAACVHLLQNYNAIPDLALVGADWLSADELSIIAYIRQTWPRTAIVVYVGQREAPRVELLPLTRVVAGEAAVREWTARTPSERVAEINAELPAVLPVRMARSAEQAGVEALLEPSKAAASEADEVAPRELLTAEELAALLGTADAP